MGTTKTKILFRAYLSYEQVREYLGFLVYKGLLHYDSTTKIYKTTEKGARFLKSYKRLETVHD